MNTRARRLSPRPLPRRSPRRRSGFTILEVLMVISIAAILLALLITGTSATINWSRARQAHATLAHLDAIVDGYYRQTGKYFDGTVATTSDFIIEAQTVVGTPDDNNSTTSGDTDLITPLGKALQKVSTGYEVIDPWGHPIRMYNPNAVGVTALRPAFLSFGPNGINDSSGLTNWAPGQAYAVGTMVIANNATWTCTAAHTSATNNGPGASGGAWTITDDIISAGGAQ
ncbi:MAG: prepilin-type N-terminal cleavage/methylation domain-containing protein [Planctomycetota bacterium]|nr:prepilin-type N-terminal cleavage/methylation domain-containing protein [Planctomycetota bacterium]